VSGSGTHGFDGAAPILGVSGVAKRYGDRDALRDVGFDVHRGELLAVIGPNGAGKTTLLSILGGLLSPTAGQIICATGRIGWVPQQPALYSKLSVAENLRLFARLERVADPDGAVSQMLEQTGLSTRSQELLSRLSGGNRQRVNIAIGLLSRPAVLLLDEPSSSLDPRQRQRLWQFIDSLAKDGVSVVFSTHNVVEAERHADRILVLAEGEVLFLGPPNALALQTGAQGELSFEEAFVRFLRERGH
jgi:ABC-2 type transport system ATP-binding protein